MLSNDLLWVAGFIGSFCLLIVSLIILWVSIRDYFEDKNKTRHLLFSLGLAMVTASYLYRDALTLSNVVTPVFYSVSIGFTLIGISLLSKKKHLLLLLLPPLVLFLPRQSLALSASSVLIIIIAILSLINNEGFFTRDECECEGVNKKHSNREWFLIFIFFALISGFHIASNFVPYPISNTFETISIVSRYLATFVIFYQIFHCVRFTKKEKYIFPALFGFLIIMVLSGFLSARTAVKREEASLRESVMEETLALKYLTEREFGEEELNKKLSEQDISLNDYLDKVYVRTGIRGTYFYKDERVASVVPQGANSRGLGTKLGNKIIENKVLIGGENWSGKIERQNRIRIAGYSPIYYKGKIIGMVATGQPVDAEVFYNKNMFSRAITGGGILMLLVLWVFLFDRQIGNSKNKK